MAVRQQFPPKQRTNKQVTIDTGRKATGIEQAGLLRRMAGMSNAKLDRLLFRPDPS